MNVSLAKYSLVAAVLLFLSVAPLRAEDEQELRRRFLNEAPQGWKRLSDILLHSRGRVELSVRAFTPEGPRTDYAGYDEDVSFLLNGAELRCVESNDKGRVTVGARNPDYTFHLKAVGLHLRSKTNRSYRVDGVEPVSTSDQWTYAREAEDHVWRISPVIYAPFAVNDLPLVDIINSDSFRLTSIGVPDRHPGLVEIQFQYQPPHEEHPWQVTATLDPSNHWAVQESRWEWMKGIHLVIWESGLQYSDEAFGETDVRLPVSAVVMASAKEDEAGHYVKREFVLKEFAVADIPESEFRLAAFGLDEPGKGQPIPVDNSHLALILFNVGAVLVIVGVWYMSRRSRAKTES